MIEQTPLGESESKGINKLVAWGRCKKDEIDCVYFDQSNLDDGGDGQTVIIPFRIFEEIVGGFLRQGIFGRVSNHKVVDEPPKQGLDTV